MADPIAVIKDLPAPSIEDAHLRALLRKTRALKALSASNAAVIHATSEQELLAKMCNAIVDVAGYRMAWIGWAQADGTVRAAAWAGTGADYVEHADIRWDDSARGRGPTGRCISARQIQVASDLMTEPSMEPWRQRALEIGYRSSVALPVQNDGLVGALSIYAIEPDAFDAEEISLLGQIADEMSFGLAALTMRQAHADASARLQRSMEATIQVLAAAAELRDPYTAGHQRRVALIATTLAEEMKLEPERIRGLKIAASVHDIGKIKVPAEILACPRRLTPVEFEIIKVHPEAGYELMKNVELPWPVATVIRQHHERLDGSGYPLGLKGEAILLETRIVAVADVLEAIASHRPYRPALGIDAALDELVRGRDRHFDPIVVDTLVRLIREKGYVIPQ